MLKAVAGNDEVKQAIVLHQGAELLLGAINKHVRNGAIAEIGCACVATVCLRQPDHCAKMMDAGAAEVILRVMQLHPQDANVQVCSIC